MVLGRSVAEKFLTQKSHLRVGHEVVSSEDPAAQLAGSWACGVNELDVGYGERSGQPSSGPAFRTAWVGWGDTLRAGLPLPVCAKHAGNTGSCKSSQLSSEADRLAPIL